MRYFFALASTYGQERHSKIDTKDLTESQLLHIDQLATQDGWVLISHNGDHYLNNFSNPDYHLRMQLNPS
ncbi:hypothetical protein [Sphingobacterium bambusae]|uniref:DUF4177 domain-containing protein n=1 Tax=Sphingobacterium bambusae TaxID=662858 RepID=A0ABW6BL45_9SPHI|nr:hypothetical protein [Sphingobacterium bambusae]WPL48160.1 hypothetical protein SCB77_19590 [Sphingobacterium bambusae]